MLPFGKTCDHHNLLILDLSKPNPNGARKCFPFNDCLYLKSLVLILWFKRCLLSCILSNIQIWCSEYQIESLRHFKTTLICLFLFVSLSLMIHLICLQTFSSFQRKPSCYISYTELSCGMKAPQSHNYISFVCNELSVIGKHLSLGFLHSALFAWLTLQTGVIPLALISFISYPEIGALSNFLAVSKPK